MECKAFLTIGDDTLSLGQALGYLKASGKLELFLSEIIRPYILEKEIQSRDSLKIDPTEIEQLTIDFRLQNELTDTESFQRWLEANKMNYADFRNQITFELKTKKLKAEVTEVKLQEYFSKRKESLVQLVLSRLVVEDRKLAQDLLKQLSAEKAQFEQLVKKYSVTDDHIIGGAMGAVSKGTMPDIIKTALEDAVAGQVVGPIKIEGRYCLLKVEKVLSVSLEGQLKQQLQDELFEQWLAEKMQEMPIRLTV